MYRTEKELGLKIHSNLLFLWVKLENGLRLHSIINKVKLSLLFAFANSTFQNIPGPVRLSRTGYFKDGKCYWSRMETQKIRRESIKPKFIDFKRYSRFFNPENSSYDFGLKSLIAEK